MAPADIENAVPNGVLYIFTTTGSRLLFHVRLRERPNTTNLTMAEAGRMALELSRTINIADLVKLEAA